MHYDGDVGVDERGKIENRFRDGDISIETLQGTDESSNCNDTCNHIAQMFTLERLFLDISYSYIRTGHLKFMPYVRVYVDSNLSTHRCPR